MTGRELIEKRREQVYTLHLRGSSVRQIAEKLGIPSSVAQYDISRVRLTNAKWYEENRDAETRMRVVYKELWDQQMDIFKEAWRLYEATDEKDVRLRTYQLNQVQQSADRLRVLLTRITPSLDDIESQKLLKELEQRVSLVEGAKKRA